jgi:hypothetical protein
MVRCPRETRTVGGIPLATASSGWRPGVDGETPDEQPQCERHFEGEHRDPDEVRHGTLNEAGNLERKDSQQQD